MRKKLSQNLIESVLKEFGISKVNKQKKLAGYYDFNYYIESRSKEYVLKASTVGTKDSLDFQNKAMKHVEKNGLVAPHVYSTKNNEEIIEKDGILFRLLSFIPGVMMNTIVPSNSLLEDTGKLLAKMDIILKDFSHSSEHEEYIWDIQHAKKLNNYLKYVKDIYHKELAKRALEEFEKISGKLKKCRKGIIHNDGHVFNVVVNNEKTKAIALIDYGDMVHSYYVCNLDVSIAGLLTTDIGNLEKASYIIKGYDSVSPLLTEEKSVLKTLVAVRLAMLGILAAHALHEDPDNTYVVETANKSWDKLPDVLDMSEEEFSKYL